MNIRIRKHNDEPNWVVAELIVDGLILDDEVCDATGRDVLQAVKTLLSSNSPLPLNHEDHIDRHPDYFLNRGGNYVINIVDPM